MKPAQILQAHKGQPTIEKRFEQINTMHEIAPVFLKNEGRIEALFTLNSSPSWCRRSSSASYAPGDDANIEELPIYPEQRPCKRPTTEPVLRLFSLAERHTLLAEGHTVQVFDVELTDLQRQVLTLLGVPLEDHRPQK